MISNAIIKKINPDIVHGCDLLTYGFYSSFVKNRPILQMAWGSDILIHSRKGIRRLIARKSLQSGDLITVDCGLGKKRMINLGIPDDKIVVFPWGVDFNIFNERNIKEVAKPSSKKTLICNRAFYPLYGIDYLLRAYNRVINKFPNTELILFNYTPLNNEPKTSDYSQLIKDLNLAEHVKILSSVTQKEMSEYLKLSDLYITTSFSDGTSVSLLEAMACGLPVVATNVGANSEWISNGVNGYLCEAGNIESITASLISILKNKKSMKKMGALNHLLVRKKADWKNNVKQLDLIYEDLLK